MKPATSFAALAIALCAAGASISTHAQTCAAPVHWTPDATGAPPVNVDLCAGTDSVALFCQFLDSSDKNDGIYTMTFVSGFAATHIAVSGTAPGFNPVTYMYSDTCTTANACLQSGDAITPLPLSGIATGTYFLAVTAAASDGAGACGQAQMTTNAFFPVELMTFDVN